MAISRRKFISTGLSGLAAGSVGAYAQSSSQSAPVGKVDRRIFGKIRVPVSILGLGLGSSFYRPYENDWEAGQALLESALKAGINYWDTAHMYGGGISERITGPVAQKHRDEIFLVSKSTNRSYDGFWRELEVSMERLGVDKIDLFHMHNLKPHDSIDEMERGCFKAVTEAKEQGIIGSYGITGHSGARILIDALLRFDPDALLTIFPCNRPDDGRYEDELLPLARERNMGVIGMKTVKHARNADLRGSDLIRYALGLDGVQGVIVGLDTQAHLDENVEMATNFEPLSEEQRIALVRNSQIALAGMTAPWDVPGYEDGGPCSFA